MLESEAQGVERDLGDEQQAPLIVHLINEDQYRGAENVAAYLNDALSERGFRSQLLALRPSAGDGRNDVTRVLSRTRWAPFPVQAIRLRRLLRRSGSTVVLAHGFRSALVASVARMGLRSSRPRLVWQRILRLPRAPGDPRYFVHRLVARRCDAVVAITEYLVEETVALGFRGPIELIPNHRPRLDVDGITGPPDGIESPYVLFAGKLVPQKRPDRFLDIVEMLVARGTQCRFVICGAGPLEPALRARVERSPALEHVVTFAGHTAEMARFLRFAECLALTSDNESSPGIAVEAMMSGCPVVAFEVDGVREIIGSAGGVVVPQGDTAAFATAVERRIESPATPAERDEIGSQASRFATEDVVDRYVEIMGLATDVASAGRAEQPGSEHSAQLALVVPNFGVGGLERGTVSLARAAQASGVGVVVVTLTAPRMESSRTLLRELSAMGVDVENVGLASPTTYRHPIRLAVATVRLRRILLASSATAVSSAILDADLPARLAARLLGIPHTCHLVNTTYTETVRVATGSRRLTFAVARLIERATSPLSRNYIALTNAVAEYAVADLKIPARKVVVIGRGVDITRFTPSEGPRRHPPVEFVSLGRLVPQKDHACTVAAFQSLGVSSVRLRVFGEGPLRDELLTMIEADCDAVVALHDPTDDVPELLRGSDVYVSSARWEGQSNALLEAMAAGSLLVLSDIDVFREVAGDCAFFFAPGDSGQLACRVSEILDADESSLDARRHAGRRIACERYSERELAGAAVSLMVGDG